MNLPFSSSGSISTFEFGQNFDQDKVIPKQDVYIHFVAPNQSKIKENILMVKIEVEKLNIYANNDDTSCMYPGSLCSDETFQFNRFNVEKQKEVSFNLSTLNTRKRYHN